VTLINNQPKMKT